MNSSLSRKILFWILTFLFLFSATSIIIYSFGYRFNRERGIFVYTGSVTIKTTLKKIRIYLDNKKIPDRKIDFLNYAYNIDGIHPGEHFLSIVADKHQTWQKHIIVHSGISTEFWNIFLAKTHYQENFYFSNYNLINFFIAPSNKKIALEERKGKRIVISLLKIQGKLFGEFTKTNIFASDKFSFLPLNSENIEWSPNERQLIIPLLDQEKNFQYFIYTLKTKEIINLNEILSQHNFPFSQEIKQVRWDDKKKNRLFFLAHHNLYALYLDKINNETYQPQKILENIVAYNISDKELYFLSSLDAIIYRIAGESYQDPQSVTQPFSDKVLQPSTKIVIYDKTRGFIIDNERNLYIYNQGERKYYQKLLNNNIINAQFSDDGKKLLYWNNNEIFVYFTRDWKTQPIRSEDEIQNITRFSQKINNVQWYKDYEHIIFNAGKQIKIIELDQRDYRNMQDLFTCSNASAKITFNSFEDRLYFIHKHNHLQNLSYITLKEK